MNECSKIERNERRTHRNIVLWGSKKMGLVRDEGEAEAEKVGIRNMLNQTSKQPLATLETKTRKYHA